MEAAGSQFSGSRSFPSKIVDCFYKFLCLIFYNFFKFCALYITKFYHAVLAKTKSQMKTTGLLG